MEGDLDTLNEQFAALKQRGANVLVLADAATEEGCHGLLGADTETRRRLYVTTEATADSVDPAGADPASVGQVHVAVGDTRATAAARTTAPEPAVGHQGQSEAAVYSRVDGPELPSIATHIHDHLSRFDEFDPEPGAIRLCFGSLDPFVDEWRTEQLAQFLRIVTARVRLSDGVGHFHLSAACAPSVRDRLEPLFDAIVERRHGTEVEQRWTLHPDRDRPLRTDWLPVRDH